MAILRKGLFKAVHGKGINRRVSEKERARNDSEGRANVLKTKKQLLQFVKETERQDAETDLKKAETDLIIARWIRDASGCIAAERAVNETKKRLIVL